MLEADPELGAGIDPAQREVALAHALAPVFNLERGPWRFRPAPNASSLGALVLDGLIFVRIQTGDRAHLELLGSGDVISPWVGMGSELTLPSLVSSRVVTPVEVALLTESFALRIARWPQIHAALIQRLIVRARRLTLQSAINGLDRIEERLDLTLWQLAYRFGRVTPDGVCVHLPLTHADLADIVASRRPSVSTALGRMQASGRLAHSARHTWILRGRSPARLEPLARQVGLQP